MQQESGGARDRHRLMQALPRPHGQKFVPARVENHIIASPALAVECLQTRRRAVNFVGQCDNGRLAELAAVFRQSRGSRTRAFAHNGLAQHRVGCIQVVVDQVRNLIGDFVSGPSHGMPRYRWHDTT